MSSYYCIRYIFFKGPIFTLRVWYKLINIWRIRKKNAVPSGTGGRAVNTEHEGREFEYHFSFQSGENLALGNINTRLIRG